MVGKVIDHLDELGLRDDTIIVLWGDHGWHLGEHAVWGKHTLFEESLRSPLIIAYPSIPRPGVSTNSIVETIDMFPTLCDLANLPVPETTIGVSLKPILEDPNSPGHAAISYFSKGNRTIRDDRYRLIVHGNGTVELYDFSSNNRVNVAAKFPEVVEELRHRLDGRMAKSGSR